MILFDFPSFFFFLRDICLFSGLTLVRVAVLLFNVAIAPKYFQILCVYSVLFLLFLPMSFAVFSF